MLKRQKQLTKTQTSEQVNEQVNMSNKNKKVVFLNSRLVSRILLLVLFIVMFAGITTAWFSGVQIIFSPGLNLSKMSSLKNSVDVIGYSYNDEYDSEDPTSQFLENVTFKTSSEINVDSSNSKSLFDGDLFEPGAINKIKRADYSSETDYNEAIKQVIAENSNTKYIKITNRSDMDIKPKVYFELSDANSTLNDLSGFWYMIENVTNTVNIQEGNSLEEKLFTYASVYKASRDNDYNELNSQANVFSNLVNKIELDAIAEAEDKTTGNTAIYRIDYGLCESVLRSSGTYYFGKNVKMNLYVYYGQTSAPTESDVVVETTIREVDSAEKLAQTLSNLNEAFNGDTIKLMADITVNGPLIINRPFNFDLNGHRLTINGGDLIFSYESSMPITVDCTRTGSIYILEKRATSSLDTSYTGSLIVNTPNGAVKFIGDNANSSGVENYDIRLDGDGCIENASKNTTGGLTLESMYIVQNKFDSVQYKYVASERLIKMDEGSKITIGEFVNIDKIYCEEIHSCYIYNNGNIGYIDLYSMDIPTFNNWYLILDNNGKIADYIGVKADDRFDVLLPRNARPYNTQVIKEKKSNDFRIGGPTSFTTDDIIDRRDTVNYIIPIANENNAYRVYLSPTTPSRNGSTLNYVFYEYFNHNEDNYAGIKKLEIIGTRGVSINQTDIQFLMSKNGQNVDYFRDLEYLDLSSISVDTLNYSNASQQKNRIPNRAFYNKVSLTTVILPSDIVYIGTEAFAGTTLSKISIPSNVIEIGTNAFSSVTDVTIKSYYPIANNKFLVAFPTYAYFFVDSSMVDTYKAWFGTNYNGINYSKHVYRYAEHISNNFYIRVVNELNPQIEIVAYTGDSSSPNICPDSLEYLGSRYDVVGVGRDAYINMTNAEGSNLYLNIGETVKYIGPRAFTNLSYIVSLETNSATSIEEEAFYECKGLRRITVNARAELGDRAFANCIVLDTVNLNNCIKIGNSTFSGDERIVSLVIPKVREIGSSAFAGCYSFESVVFGEIEIIGDATFKGCSNLQTVVLSSVTKEIGASCFEGCTRLVAIASTVAGLTNHYISLDYLEKIGNNAFKGCTGIECVKAPNVKHIGDSAFIGCTNLTYISAPLSLYVGSRAFYNLTSLTQVDIVSATEIGDEAFRNSGIKYIDIPYATKIGLSAFRNCSNIIEISMGNPLEIKNYAFYGVSPRYVDVSAYTFGSDLTVPDVPDVSTFAYGGNNLWHQFTSEVRYYYRSGRTEQNEINERKNYLYAVLRASYFAQYDPEDQEYYNDSRGNLSVDYIFEKDQFYGDWIISTSDNYIVKNINLYNIKITTEVVEGNTVYTGEILSYHGQKLIGNVIIPTSTYYPDGLTNEVFNNKNDSLYSGVFRITIEGVSRNVSITKIGYYAYENVDGATTINSMQITNDEYCHVSFANSVIEIADGAFRYSKIDFVDLNKVQIVGKDAFRNTTELRYVDLGDCVSIGSYAFSSYRGTQTLWEKYTQYGRNFYVSDFSKTVLTKVVFRHVDYIDEGAFYQNFVDNKTFTILDFSQNAPGLDDSYNLGFGPNKRYNVPTNVHQIWRGYNETLYYYSSRYWEVEYNDINVLAPYYESDEGLIETAYLSIIDSEHLFYDYGYTYRPDYKINGVKVGMFWLQPGNLADPSQGFVITKSLIRDFGNDTTLEGLTVTNASTNRYMYTIPSKLYGQYIFNERTGVSLTNGQIYNAKIGTASFKNSTVKKNYIVDITFGEGITKVPTNAFKFAEFKNVYLTDVTELATESFAYSGCQIVYGFKLERIRNDAFYDSTVTTIDLRQNKQLVGEGDDAHYETIYTTFDDYYYLIYHSRIKAIYVNEDDLDGYISRTNQNTWYDSNVELYVYIKALGTHAGTINLNYNSTYNIESILSPYIEDPENEYIEWRVINDPVHKISCVEGVISVNQDPFSDIDSNYMSGTADVYCIKHIGNTTQILGKFHISITTDETTVEYYNIAKSIETRTNAANNTFSGYRIISYTGTQLTGVFDPSEEFNTFMQTNISTDDINNYPIFSYRDPVTGNYEIFELSVGSYMNMTIPNDELVYLYTGKYITKIGDYAFYSISFREVWLSNVTIVGRRAFQNQRSTNVLTTVVMPKVVEIQQQAFYNNANLETVVIGANKVSNLTSIGYYGFAGCTSMIKFGVISLNLIDQEASAYYNMRNYVGNFTSLPTYYWLKNETHTTVDGVSYDYYSYYYNSDLVVDGKKYGILYLPDTVRTLGERVFYHCNSIDAIRYPNTAEVTSVPYRAFEAMTKLHCVKLGRYVTSIGQEAFAYCENLVSTPYPDVTKTNIESLLSAISFGYTYSSPHGVNSIYYGVDGIDLSYIKTIGTGSFKACHNLDNLYLDSIESIGSEAFFDCTSLRYINFELNNPREGLRKVTFGSKWNYSTYDIKRYYVRSDVKSYFTDAVYIYCRDTELLQYGLTSDYVLSYIRNPLATSEILGVKIVCYNGDTLEAIPSSFEINGYTYSTLTIGSYAYYGLPYNTLLDTVELPSTVTTIEDYAFAGTLFTEYVELPNSYNSTKYGKNVFDGNIKLEEVTFVRMASGGSSFFNDCSNMTLMNLQNNYVNGVYTAPVLSDDFFNGGPSRTKCQVKENMTHLFTAVAYMGHIYEDSETIDSTGLYAVKLGPDDKITIIHYIGTTALGSDGTYTIPTILTIPDQGTYQVNKIAEGAFKDAEVSTRANLVIGDNIENIGQRAFYNTKFGSITFTGTDLATVIGDYAFAEMTYLMDVDISNVSNVTGKHMFDGDELLATFNMSQTITMIPDYFFAGCTNLDTINIGIPLVAIGEHAFENCSSLRQIIFNNDTAWQDRNTFDLGNVTTIGDYAFSGCENISRLIGMNVTSLGAYSFGDCIRLLTVNLNRSLNFIGEGTFYQCSSLQTAVAYTTYIPEKCYYGCSSIYTVDTTGARSIEAQAFYQCTTIEELNLLSVKVVGASAFYQCTSLSTIDLGTATTIGAHAFDGCALSGELDLNSVESIGDYAYANNTGLTKVIFNSVSTIGNFVFNKDLWIEEFDFTDNKNSNGQFINPDVGTRSLENINSTFFIYVDRSVIGNYERQFSSWKHRIFSRGVVYSSDPEYMVREYDSSSYEIVRYLGSGLTGNYRVPQTINGKPVVSIGRYAYYNSFSDSSNLKVLDLGTNIINVGNYAFYNFDFETISMPNVETIGQYAFAKNENLNYLSLESATSISGYAFSENINLQLVRLYDTLQRIENGAFDKCDYLRSVYMANTTNLNSLNIPYQGKYIFGQLTTNDATIRVPNQYLSQYKTKLSYYSERIKAGELDDADFSYRVVNENGQDVIEIIAYEGQNTSVKIKAVINGLRVARILNNAFENSMNLETVILPDTLMSISSHAFMGNSSIKSVQVLSDTQDDQDKITYSSQFTDNRQYFIAYDGVLFMQSQLVISGDTVEKPTTLVYYPVAKEDTSYSFTSNISGADLSSLDMIYENAFYGNTYIEHITVPYNIRRIGENAFAYCPSLTVLEFVPPYDSPVVPMILGTNILTNCNPDLVIVVGTQNYLDKFLENEYYKYYKERFVISI